MPLDAGGFAKAGIPLLQAPDGSISQPAPYVLTGSDTIPMLSLTGTVDTSGNINVLSFDLTTTNLGATSTLLRLRTTSSGIGFSFFDCVNNATSQFKVSHAGVVTAVGAVTAANFRATTAGIAYDADRIWLTSSYFLSWGTGQFSGQDLTVGRSGPGALSISDNANGKALGIKSLTELLTIAAAATSTTTIQKPAHSIILAVSVRVTVAVTCTSVFEVGDSTSANRFNTASVSKAATTTDKGTKAGAYYNATAEGIIITPDTVPSDATGRVRVTVHYLEIQPPTS